MKFKKWRIFDEEKFSQNINNIIVAEINNLVVGTIKYLIKEKLENSYTNYRKVLFIDALVVDVNHRKNGIGKILMQEMEKYFKSIGCKYISIEVFAYNKNAIKFYEKEGYHTRCLFDIKKI